MTTYNIDNINYKIEIRLDNRNVERLYMTINGQKIHHDDKVKFRCEKCKKDVTILYTRFLRKKKERKLCNNCQLTESRLNSPLRFRSEDTREKMKKTIHEKGYYIEDVEVESECPMCHRKFKWRRVRSYNHRDKIYDTDECRKKAFAIAGSKQGGQGYKGMLANKKYNTGLEKLLEDYLEANKIGYTYQQKFGPHMFDFELNDGTLIETDGDFWHAKELPCKKLVVLEKIVKDEMKTRYCQRTNKKLIRLWESDIKAGNIDLSKTTSNRTFHFMDIILTKDLLLSSSLDDLERLIPILRKWCRLFFPEFVIDYAVDPLPEIYRQITNKRDFWAHPHSGFNPGNLFLKNRFMSFWKGVRGHKISVVEAYYDDAILDKILRYRLGLNAKRETFDISMRHIVRGFISGGYSISWFAPVIAYEIYKKYAVGCKTMYDPCAGFGARQLAWKAFGGDEYYGVDANPETVLENQNLMKEIGLNGEIYCDLAENFKLDHKVDFAFTCPPYFNAENYSKPLLDYNNSTTDFLYPLIENTLAVAEKFVIVVNKEMAEAIEQKYTVKEKHLIGNTASHLTGRRNYEVVILL